VDPVTPGTLYAGTDTSGAYRSADSGNSWREIDDGLQVAGYPVVGVSRIVIDPSQPARVYASVTFTGEANSFDTVYRSDDGGGHWQPANDGLPDGFSGDVPLVLDPSNPSTLFAAVQPAGVYRSTDGGETWAAFGTGLPGDVIGLAIDPADSQQMYASVQFGVYRSVDAGATWTEADGGLPNAQLWNVTFDPVRPDTAYAGGFYYGVYATVDGGLSWTPMNAGLRNKGILALRVDAVGSRLFAGTQGHGVFVLPLG